MRHFLGRKVALLAPLLALLLWEGCADRGAAPPADKPPADEQPKNGDSATTPAGAADQTADGGAAAVTPRKDPGGSKPAAESGHTDSGRTNTAVDNTSDSASEAGDPDAEVASATGASEYGKSGEAPPGADKLFVNWPKPQALLLFSGDQRGYIEPCGCAGLENQKGGLKRRHTFVKQMQERGWPVALFDLGEQVRRFGVQAEYKFRTAIQSLSAIGYSAVGFGPDDLQLPAEQLLLAALDLPEDRQFFVSANVVNSAAPETIATWKLIEVGGRKIAVTGTLGPTFQGRVRNDLIAIAPAEEAIAAVLPKMSAEADFLVLLSNSTRDEAIEQAKKFPQFDLVVTAGGGEPPLDLRVIEGTKKSRLVDVGEKGMYLIAVGLFDDVQNPIRYQRVPLDARFVDSPQMQKLFVDYQGVLKAIGLDGLGVKPRPHASGREFVGSAKCGDCHTKAFAVWKKTPHAHAWETLTKLKPPRQFDAECLSCHVTGWELKPGAYIPYLSGYASEEKSPHLLSNGCENCHGPGSAHVAAESGDVEASQEMLDMLRNSMRLPLAKAEATCVKCHDHDNSPEFEEKGFEHYWREVQHKGKD